MTPPILAAPPTAVTVQRTAPLSPGQERLLDAEYRHADGTWPAFGAPGRLRPIDTAAVLVDGPLDLALLERAATMLTARQAALRTTVRLRRDAPPVQIVAPPRAGTLPLTDLPPRAQLCTVEDLAAAFPHPPTSPTDPEHFRIEVARLAPDRHAILLRIHHLISDGWSIALLYRELSEFYAALAERRTPDLPPLHRSFADLCVAMRQQRSSEQALQQLDYWARELAGPWGELAFPGDAPGPHPGTTPVSTIPVHCPAAVLAAADDGRAEGSRPAGLAGPVLSALALVLHAHTAVQDLRIGTMISNRAQADREHVIGNFVNIAVIRLRLDPSAPLSALAAQAGRKTAAAMDHQDTPVQDVLRHLAATHPGLPKRLYRVTLALNTMRRGSLELPGTTCTDLPAAIQGDVREAPTSIDLRWVFEPAPDGLAGTLTYNTSLFSRDAIHCHVRQFHAALRALGQTRTSDRSIGAFTEHLRAAEPPGSPAVPGV